jgi:hypothetical protein
MLKYVFLLRNFEVFVSYFQHTGALQKIPKMQDGNF